MKRLFSRLCGMALAAALLVSALPVSGARAAGIQVTLNDQPVAFSDAQPLMRRPTMSKNRRWSKPGTLCRKFLPKAHCWTCQNECR